MLLADGVSRPEQFKLYVITRMAHITYVVQLGGFWVKPITTNSLRWEHHVSNAVMKLLLKGASR